MKPISLRSLVSTIGLVVAIVTAIALPSGVLFVSYTNTAETLAFKARLNADRIALYIYTHRGLWQYQQVRLVEQVKLPTLGEDPILQTLHANDGLLVFEDGPALPAPVVARRAAVVVSGETLGHLEVAVSFRDHLYQAGLAGVVSSLLGFGMYFALRTFPLRVLDRTLGTLQAAQENLSTQNERLDAALANMSQGLCMFGADQKLLIFNRRFAEIYGQPAEKIRPGMTLGELTILAASPDKPADADLAGTLGLQKKMFREGKEGSFVERLIDGRSISISYRPMPKGGFVATFGDITERLRAEDRIRHLAHHDALTGLPNRVAFYERMEAVLRHLRRGESVAVLSLDLDRFKSVNDTLGHPIGDLLLEAAADRMRSCVRGADIVARLGGDEFAIVQVPTEEPLDINALARRLIDVVGAPYDLEDHQVIVGVSVGVATAPEDGDKPDILIKNADLALYRAKADGGGVYRFFEAEMDARMQARRVIELDLRKAIKNGEFELLYQPIVDVKTGQITTCEALVRWRHPERGTIMPIDFIRVAEETGLIVPLGEWVLRQACAEAARWPAHVVVAVNLSPAQFKNRNLLATIMSALALADLSPGRLELEITEMVLLEDNAEAFAILHQLRDLRVKIAMDDFGTGYSSLGYLRSFPFDKIKIDQSFIRDLPGKEDSVAIVRAVVGLSSSLGITSTAEGVETEAQLASLAIEGCNEFQGFLFSHARSAADVGRILADQVPLAEAAA